MKLLEAKVKDYKSVVDSGWVQFDEHVTRGGDRADPLIADFMQALFRFNSSVRGVQAWDAKDIRRNGWLHDHGQELMRIPVIVVSAKYCQRPESCGNTEFTV